MRQDILSLLAELLDDYGSVLIERTRESGVVYDTVIFGDYKVCKAALELVRDYRGHLREAIEEAASYTTE